LEHRLQKRLLQVLPAIVLALGLTVAAVSCQRIHDRSLLASEGVMVTGVVRRASSSTRSNTISVGYRDSNEREWSKDFAVSSSQYRPGQSVEILYLPANPRVALLGSHEAGATHAQDIYAAVIGVILLAAGAVMAVVIYGRGSEE
jgi:hypothetical protein